MAWLVHFLEIVALVYAAVCVVYFFFQERFLFVHAFPVDVFRNKLATRSESFIVHTPNNGRIHCLLLQPERSKGLIFYLHGNTGSLQRWQFMAEELATYGYDVCALDYRGYGLSTGRLRESFMHRDVEYVYDWIRPRYASRPVIVYGRSLGTGFATRVAARRKPDKLVLETPFYRLLDAARHYLPFLPVRWLMRYHFRSDVHIQLVDCPIHIFHGTRDVIVPYSSALRLFRSVEGKKEVHMTTIVGGKHSNLNSFPLFREKLAEFLG